MIKDRLILYSRMIVEIVHKARDNGLVPQKDNPVDLSQGWQWFNEYLFKRENEDEKVRVSLDARTQYEGHLVAGLKSREKPNHFAYEVAIPLYDYPAPNIPLENRARGVGYETAKEDLQEIAMFLSSLAHSLELWLLLAGEMSEGTGANLERKLPLTPVVLEVFVPEAARNGQGNEKSYGYVKITEEQFYTLREHKVFDSLPHLVMADIFKQIELRKGFFIHRDAIYGTQKVRQLHGLRIVPCRFLDSDKGISISKAMTEELFHREQKYWQ